MGDNFRDSDEESSSLPESESKDVTVIPEFHLDKVTPSRLDLEKELATQLALQGFAIRITDGDTTVSSTGMWIIMFDSLEAFNTFVALHGLPEFSALDAMRRGEVSLLEDELQICWNWNDAFKGKLLATALARAAQLEKDFGDPAKAKIFEARAAEISGTRRNSFKIADLPATMQDLVMKALS